MEKQGEGLVAPLEVGQGPEELDAGCEGLAGIGSIGGLDPWLSPLSVLEDPGCPEGNPDLPMGDHVDLRFREVQLIVEDHMEGMLDG